MFKLLLFSLCTELGYASVSQDGYYMVSAAGTIFSGRPYGVVVGMFESKASCSCEVFLTGPSINMSIEMHLTPLHPISSYSFELPELSKGIYWLTVNSLRGMRFTNKTQLTWQNFQSFVKIQTPKIIYRPGELLQFRVLFHNATMNPVKPEYQASIWIEDAKGYHVKFINELEVNKGVFQSDLRISRSPNVGRWRICVKNGRTVTEKCVHIYVKENQIPSLYKPIEGKIALESRTFSGPLVYHQYGQLNKEPKHKQKSRFKRSGIKKLMSKELSNEKNNIFVNSSTANLSDVTIMPRTIPQAHARDLKRNENLIQILYGEPVGKPRLIKFQLDHKLSYAICVIMFNGIILASGEVFPDKQNTFSVEVQLTTKVWPFVHLFFYGMESKSNVLYVATHMVEVERWKHEHVEIEAPSEVKPGETISLRIKAVPKSYLGLTAVDSRDFREEYNHDFSLNYFKEVKAVLQAASATKLLNETATHLNMGLVTMTNADSVSHVEINILNKPAADSMPLNSDSETRKNVTSKKVAYRTEVEVDDPYEIELTAASLKRWSPGMAKVANGCCHIPSSMKAVTNNVWIFDSIQHTQAGWRNWTVRVPEEITTWRLNAFQVDPHVGLTLLGHKPFINIKSTQSIYLQYTVPIHIKIDEILVIPINCFNSLVHTLNVTIRVKQNESNYQLLDEHQMVLNNSEHIEQELIVKSNTSNFVTIYLRPIKSGEINVNVTAISGSLSDMMIRQIKVLPIGQIMSHQMVAFETLNWRNMKSNFELKLPHQHTSDGVKCYLTGNMIAANIQSIKPIDRMDNGEQLITKLLAIYYLWDYMQDQPQISRRWRQFLDDQLNDGFQSLMRLRGRDGSFTYSEEPKSNCSSTWLTAYGLHVLYFLQSTPVRFHPRLITQSENVLLSRRPNRIQFIDKCVTPQRRKISQLELSLDMLKVLQVSTRMIRIQESHGWISRELSNHSDYHLEAKRAHNLPIWKRPDEHTDCNWMDHRRNIETAARILTGQINQRKVPQFEIYKWLIPRLYGDSCKHNSFECFIARQAIYNYVRAPKDNPPLDLTVSMWGKPTEKQSIKINEANQWKAQKVFLHAHNQTLNFEAKGLGELLVRCSYEYDLRNIQNQTNNKYELRVTQLKAVRDSESFLKFCVQRLNSDQNLYIGTEIALHLPSGYVLAPKRVNRLVVYKIVLQAGSDDGYTKVLVRFGALQPNIFTCMSVLATRLYTVDNLQPGMMTAYDTNSLEEPQVLAYKLTF